MQLGEAEEAVKKDHPGATIIPIIISFNKTQLPVFGNKTTYPIYMTLGNIPKEIRRKPSRCGYILLGYLPTSKMKNIKNKAACCHVLANVFHACMAFIFEALKEAGIQGMAVTSGDGVMRRGHPIYATFVGDYPEQCPTCDVPRDEFGEDTKFPLHDLEKILEALDTLDEGPTVYKKVCVEAGIKPVYHPFWEGLPYTNIFRSITHDILHQLYQEIMKHLISWLKAACGEAELDARCRRLPPNHNIRLFLNGISGLNRVTGKEHHQISRFILGIIIGIQLPDDLPSSCLLAAVRGILDFLHLAQAFIDLRVRPDFNLPKLHGCAYYPMYIKLFDAYRSTNFKDKFSQMTLWLKRREKIFRHENPAPPTVTPLPPGIFPTMKAVKITHSFRDALARFIIQLNNPTFTRQQIVTASLPVFHHPYTAGGPGDSVPAKSARSGKRLAGRFDTALVNNGSGGLTGVGATTPSRPLRTPPDHLVYVEWFSPFTPQPEPHHLMYLIKRIYLLPRFSPVAPLHWTSDNVLEQCSLFYVNCFSDCHVYTTV
ncbi:hypothetical protein C8R45DRAFT_1057423 [Mycena sanguinolenta]|nr:hypothetical protein C8R45DRAFT_1057423 [Mycena sanguinolenta]